MVPMAGRLLLLLHLAGLQDTKQSVMQGIILCPALYLSDLATVRQASREQP